MKSHGAAQFRRKGFAFLIKLAFLVQVFELIVLTQTRPTKPNQRSAQQTGRIFNRVHLGSEVLIDVKIYNQTHSLFNQTLQFSYSFEAEEQTLEFEAEVFQGMGNISVRSDFYIFDHQAGNFTLTYSETSNLTKFKKNFAHSQSAKIAGDLSSASKGNFSLHIAKDFNILALIADTVFPQSQKALLRRLKLNVSNFHYNGKYLEATYLPRIDLSQMHIPYKYYVSIPALLSGENVSNEPQQTWSALYQQINPSIQTLQTSLETLHLENHQHDLGTNTITNFSLNQNGTLRHTVKIHVLPYSLLKYFTFYQMFDPEERKKMQEINPLYKLMVDEESLDDMKELLFTNNLYIVGFTIVLSLLKSFFEIFALKNEYKIWKQIEKHKGLSIKILYTNLIFEVIFLLYVIDQQSNKMYYFTSLIGIAMTLWKLTNTVYFTKTNWGNRLPFSVPVPQHYDWCKKYSDIDGQSVKYFYWGMLPLFGLYLVYELSQISSISVAWSYSWVLEKVFAFLVLAGFIRMMPQLYINYKLKSVDHLPWKVLIYRFIETIIDDFFVFLVTTPFLQKVMVFREDVIFLGYLYQRMIYKTDPNRIGLSSGATFDSQNNMEKLQKQKPE